MRIAFYTKPGDPTCEHTLSELRQACAKYHHDLVIWSNDHGDGFTGNYHLEPPYAFADGICYSRPSAIQELILRLRLRLQSQQSP